MGDFTDAARLTATFCVAGHRCHFVSRSRASWGIHSSGTLDHTEYYVSTFCSGSCSPECLALWEMIWQLLCCGSPSRALCWYQNFCRFYAEEFLNLRVKSAPGSLTRFSTFPLALAALCYFSRSGLSIRRQQGLSNPAYGRMLTTIGFRLSWAKWDTFLSSSRIWNRRYLDYFVGLMPPTTFQLHPAWTLRLYLVWWYFYTRSNRSSW